MRVPQPNFQYGYSTFGHVGSTEIFFWADYEQLLTAVFSSFHGHFFFLKRCVRIYLIHSVRASCCSFRQGRRNQRVGWRKLNCKFNSKSHQEMTCQFLYMYVHCVCPRPLSNFEASTVPPSRSLPHKQHNDGGKNKVTIRVIY